MKICVALFLAFAASVSAEEFKELNVAELGQFDASPEDLAAVLKEDEEDPQHYVITLDEETRGKDNHEHCGYWSETGECGSNPIFMKHICPISCGISPSQEVDAVEELIQSVEKPETDYQPLDYNEEDPIPQEVLDYQEQPEPVFEAPLELPITEIVEPVIEEEPIIAEESEDSSEYQFDNEGLPIFDDEDVKDKACADFDESCESWAALGECFNNPSYMRKHCGMSCGECNAPIEPETTPIAAEFQDYQLQIPQPQQPQYIDPSLYYNQQPHVAQYPEYSVLDSAPADGSQQNPQYSAYPQLELQAAYNEESPEISAAQHQQVAGLPTQYPQYNIPQYQQTAFPGQISPQQMAQFQAEFAAQATQGQEHPLQFSAEELKKFQTEFAAQANPNLSPEELSRFQEEFSNAPEGSEISQLTAEKVQEFSQGNLNALPTAFAEFHKRLGAAAPPAKFPEWNELVDNYYAGVQTAPMSGFTYGASPYGASPYGASPYGASPFGAGVFSSSSLYYPQYSAGSGFAGLPRLIKKKSA